MGQAGRGAAQRSSPLLRDEPSPSASTLGAASPTASSPHGRDMFSYRLPTFPRNVSICQLAGGASEEESKAHKRIQRKLIGALVLALIFMIIEVVGGIYAHSLAIITDAAHLLSDVSGFAVAALAAHWAKRRSRDHFSYGYHRVEVLGALASVMTVWLVTGVLLFEAVQRIITPEHVDGKIMFIVALMGVGCNLLMMAILGHHHGPGHSHDHGHGHSHSQAEESSHGGHAHGGSGCCNGTGAADKALGPAMDEAAQQAQQANVAGGVDLEAGAGQHHGHNHGHGGCSHSHSEGEDGHARHHSSEEEHAPILAAAGQHKHGSSCGGHAHEHGPAHGGSSSMAAARSSGGGGGGGGCDRANLNVRGAIIHVIGDFVQSIGVCIAGALIWYHQDDPRWYIADPICTFLFAALVLWTTRAILRDISDVLMERVPRGLCIHTINDDLTRVRGVEDIHDLHVWSLTPGIALLCAHVVLSAEADPSGVLHELNSYCRSIGIEHSTIQLVVNGDACPCAC